jgi:hypothetical protein
MHRIIRTALASLGAAVVVAGGSLGVAYATTPTSNPAQTSAAGDSDQVAALNKQADDLLAKIATLEKQLASTAAPTSSPSELTKQEIAATDQSVFPASQSTGTTAKAPVTSASPTAAASTSQRAGGQDSKNGNNTND